MNTPPPTPAEGAKTEGGDAAITLENLTVSYRQHPALHHISGRFARGSLTAVMGPNGAGKSTLLKSLVALVPVDRNSRVVLSLGPAHGLPAAA